MRLTKLINLQAFKDLDDLENCAKRRRSRLIHCCFFFTLTLYKQLNQKGAATFRGRLAKIWNKNDLECWVNGRFPAKPRALGASAWLSWHRNCLIDFGWVQPAKPGKGVAIASGGSYSQLAEKPWLPRAIKLKCPGPKAWAKPQKELFLSRFTIFNQ